MECFNKALLAKQLWRRVVQPQSLVAITLCEKYCPCWNLLEAKAKSYHFLLWQSLLETTDVLQLGLRWRVGNCEKLEFGAINDSLLPSLKEFNLSLKFLPGRATIKELIDGRCWNSRLIMEIFWKEENQIIFDNPLGINKREDKLTWPLTEHERFTVKSAHFAALGVKRESKGLTSNSSSSSWTNLWTLSILENVKKFLWRIHTTSLPTKSNLYIRRITSDLAFPICL